jgi:hypothetical protein
MWEGEMPVKGQDEEDGSFQEIGHRTRRLVTEHIGAEFQS